MPEEKQVVNLNTDPTPVIDRTPPIQEPVETPEPSTEVPVEAEAPIPAVPAANLDVDEFGVPWKNRAMEWKRKSEEFVDRLPQLIDEKLSKVTQPQTPQYSYEDLDVFKAQQQGLLGSDPSAANNIKWATSEQRKIQQAEQRKMFEEVVGSREQVNKAEQVRQQSLQYVQNTYPEAFQHDAQGNPIAWNESHPITQQIRGIMQAPEFSGNPRGLAAAADISYGRVARSQAPQIQQKLKQSQADIKQAQKASLTEGSGRRVTVQEPVHQTAINTLKKTGSMQDAGNAIGAILKQKGILSD